MRGDGSKTSVCEQADERFDLLSRICEERMMGFEPTTFCMASVPWIRAKERRKPYG
jgi:hypothetical protein